MNVLYLGNYRVPWTTETHVTASLETLGHTVHRLQEDKTAWAEIPPVVDNLGVDVLIWQRTWPARLSEVVPQLDRLRVMGVPSVAFHLDRFWGLARESQIDEQPFFRCDLLVTPDDSPKWAEHGIRHLWLPPGVFADECGRIEPDYDRWPHDVVFVGSHPYPHPEWEPYRSELIRRFQAEFGDRFAVWPQGQVVRGRDLQELYASAKVVLGDSCLAGETHAYWSDRVPECLGRGGLLIHPEADRLAEWYVHGVDLLTYELGDFDEAVDLAQWALDNPDRARRIAEHGRRTVLARDSYAHRMTTVLEHVAELPLAV